MHDKNFSAFFAETDHIIGRNELFTEIHANSKHQLH